MTVISGHGSTSGETNFTSTDKLYLLSTKEAWGEAKGDTVDIETKQLDYYKKLGVTLSNYSGAIKQYNGSGDYWWLRSAYSFGPGIFLYVYVDGNWGNDGYSSGYCGISPAFRIA